MNKMFYVIASINRHGDVDSYYQDEEHDNFSRLHTARAFLSVELAVTALQRLNDIFEDQGYDLKILGCQYPTDGFIRL